MKCICHHRSWHVPQLMLGEHIFYPLSIVWCVVIFTKFGRGNTPSTETFIKMRRIGRRNFVMSGWFQKRDLHVDNLAWELFHEILGLLFRPFGKMKGSDRKLSNNLEGIDHRRMNLQGKDFGMQILLVDLRWGCSVLWSWNCILFTWNQDCICSIEYLQKKLKNRIKFYEVCQHQK